MSLYSVGVWYPRNIEVEAMSIKEAIEKVREGEGEYAQDDEPCQEIRVMGRNAVAKLEERQ